jgi:hypothetical protein
MKTSRLEYQKIENFDDHRDNGCYSGLQLFAILHIVAIKFVSLTGIF